VTLFCFFLLKKEREKQHHNTNKRKYEKQIEIGIPPQERMERVLLNIHSIIRIKDA